MLVYVNLPIWLLYLIVRYRCFVQMCSEHGWPFWAIELTKGGGGIEAEV